MTNGEGTNGLKVKFENSIKFSWKEIIYVIAFVIGFIITVNTFSRDIDSRVKINSIEITKHEKNDDRHWTKQEREDFAIIKQQVKDIHEYIMAKKRDGK